MSEVLSNVLTEKFDTDDLPPARQCVAECCTSTSMCQLSDMQGVYECSPGTL